VNDSSSLRQRSVSDLIRDAVPLVAVGVTAGAIGASYLLVLEVLQHWLWPGGNPAIVQGALLVGTGIVLAAVAGWIGPGGDVELLVDNIHVLGSATSDKGDRALIPLSLVGVAVGGALGPEAPLVQTCGTVGTWIARRFRRPAPDVRVLTIAGMAAGFTVLFGAPIGGTVFALEILHRRGLEYYEALVPSFIGGLAGYAVFVTITHLGLRPVWNLDAVGAITVADLGGAALAGVLGAGVAAGFVVTVRFLRRITASLPVWSLPVIAGAAMAALALWSPYALTFGEEQLPHLLVPGMTAGALVIALVAKFLATSACLVGRWKGGFIIPLFFCGAAVGQLAAHIVPGVSDTVLVAGVMVAAVVGVMNTPLGAPLVVTEMSGLALLPTTLIASIVSLGLTRPLTLIDSQRSRVVESRTSDVG